MNVKVHSITFDQNSWYNFNFSLGKPKGQFQKEYRKWKKAKEGGTYLAKERARHKKNYAKVEDLKSDDATRCREKTQERVRKHRQAQKEMTKNDNVVIVAIDFRKKGSKKCLVKFLNREQPWNSKATY